MILLVVFVPSSFFVSNIFEGLIWFLLPSCLIIVNDIMAYLAGGGGGGRGGAGGFRAEEGAWFCVRGGGGGVRE